MNQQMRFSPTVEARLAGAVMRVLRHFAHKYGRSAVMDHVDHADFSQALLADLQPSIRLELLRARLDALQIQPDDREGEKRKTLKEIEDMELSQEAT